MPIFYSLSFIINSYIRKICVPIPSHSWVLNSAAVNIKKNKLKDTGTDILHHIAI